MNQVILKRLVSQALEEDLGTGDITGRSYTDLPALGRIVAEDDIVVAGLEVAVETFHQVDPDIEVELVVADGDSVTHGDVLLTCTGSGAALLAAERVALNFTQRMCGIATLTRHFAEAVSGTGAKVADTRKTTPGLRMMGKYAVRMGGGSNHRMGLFDGVLIKDNHIELAGSMANAVARAKRTCGHGYKIEVETSDLHQVQQALDLKADIIMLDNFELDTMREAVKLIGKAAIIEASGGVTLNTVRAIAETGVDIISIGRLTHSAPAAEISMDIFPA
jgi:nicotinate-nucleotide pyrophosphorylase (carboxylating)